MLEDLELYLMCNMLDMSKINVVHVLDKEYQIIAKEQDDERALNLIQEVIAQVDRDEAHPVVMNGNEVLTKVIQQPQLNSENALFIVVEITPVK